MQAIAKSRKPCWIVITKSLIAASAACGDFGVNGHYYANFMVSDGLGHKTSQFVPFKGVGFAEAKADYDRLRVERDDDRLRPLGLTPKLSDYFKGSYAKHLNAMGKRNSTVKKETGCLYKWCEKLGHLRLKKIRTHHITRVLTDLHEEEYSGRSISLYLIAFRLIH